jgi:hypothetical protein
MSTLIENASPSANSVNRPRDDEIAASGKTNQGQDESPPGSPRSERGSQRSDTLRSPTQGDIAETLTFLHRPSVLDPTFQQPVAPALTAEQFQQLLGHLTSSMRPASTAGATKADCPLAIAWAEFYIKTSNDYFNCA